MSGQSMAPWAPTAVWGPGAGSKLEILSLFMLLHENS